MRFRHTLALTGAIVALDRLTKWAFQDANLDVIPGVLCLRGIRNTGAAFGLLAGSPWLLAAVGIAVVLVLMVYLYKERPGGFYGLGLALVAAGALGNLLDRVFLGHVVDFIQLTFLTFPVFNVADISVTLGCGLCILGLLRPQEASHE